LETSTFKTSPLYLEDMQVGDRWLSDWREITGDDVADFALLTGDNDPLHTPAGSASPFGEPVAHGLLGLSILAGLSSEKPNVATLALVGISDWQFEAPIFFGDRVQVATEIESIQQHGRRAGRVTWIRQLLNQHGRVVQRGRIVSLVATRARARRLSSQEETQRGTLPAR
jgi:3-hydroxybutyryl-CoA dehydratase